MTSLVVKIDIPKKWTAQPPHNVSIKVQKGPYKSHPPILSCIGSFLFSKCHLKKLIIFSPIYVKDWNQVIQELKLTPYHPNIDSTNQPQTLSIERPLKVSKIFMKNNIFELDDIYRLQTCGTPMGTSWACVYVLTLLYTGRKLNVNTL